MMDMREQVKNLGVTIQNDIVLKIKSTLNPSFQKGGMFEVALGSGKTLISKAVIVATGAEARWLSIPKEQELIGKGVSGCATCDGNFFRDKIVAVVGGGNAACEDAEFLAKICQKVYLIHRRDSLRAIAIEAERVLKNSKIEMIWDSEVVGINYELQITNYKLEKLQNIKIKNNKTGEEKVIEIDGLFVAIGRIPATDFLKGMVEMKETGYIITGKNPEYITMTSVPGIFAAGDCMDDNYRQAVVAAGSGAKAAIDTERWLMTV